MSDADACRKDLEENYNTPNDLESRHACGFFGLYRHVRDALVSLGDAQAIEIWAENGDWPERQIFEKGDTVESKFRDAHGVVKHANLGEVVKVTDHHLHVQSQTGFVALWNLDGSPVRSDSNYFLVRQNSSLSYE